MVGFRILLVMAVSLLSIKPAVASYECEYARSTIKAGIEDCEEYKALYPGFTFTTFISKPSVDDYAAYICLGRSDDDPPGGYTINYLSPFFRGKCLTRDPIEPPRNEDPRKTCGSIIEVSNKVVGEIIPLIGSSFNLVYYSNRVIGRTADYILEVPTTPAEITSTFLGANLVIKNENDTTIFSQSYGATAGLKYNYVWNGLDASSNESWAKSKRTFVTTENHSDFNLFPLERVLYVGNLKAKKLGTGAWLPSVWHFYDSEAQILFKGDGSFRSVKGIVEGSYIRVADVSGKEVYYFDNTGKISHTKTGLTGTIIYTFAYDSSERLLSITEPFSKVTTFSRYVSGALKAIIAPNGAKASITINGNGYLSKVANPNNEIYLMTYDGAGGLLKTFMPPNGNITTLNYDSLGNLISDVHSSGFSATLTETINGTNSTSAEGRIHSTIFDQNGGSEITRTPSGQEYRKTTGYNVEQIDNPTDISYTYFDNDPRFGNQVKMKSGSNVENFGGRQTTFSKEVVLNSPSDLFSINTMKDISRIFNSEVTSEYEGSTRTRTTTTKLGRTNKVQIDEYERVIMEQQGNLVPKNYVYNNSMLYKSTQGTRKQVMSYYSNDLLKSVRNSLDQVTTYTYDAAQRIKTKTLPDLRVITYTYDSNGNMTSITPPGRSSHQLTFGTNDQLTSYNPPTVTGVLTPNTIYTYNNDKQVTKITRPDGQEINYTYDSVTGLETTMSGSFGTISTEHAKDLPFGYTDQDGNAIHQFYRGTTPSLQRYMKEGNQIYEYERIPASDAGEKIGSETLYASGPGSVAQTILHTYDDDEYKSKVGDLSIKYDIPNGQLAQTSLGSVKDYYYYNAFGELRKYVAKFKANVIYQYELERDGIGRITKKTEVLNNVTSVFDYVYDSAGRLIQVSTGGVVSSVYAYDSNSNRIGGIIRGESTSATYDEQDRLTSYNGMALTYNANGELLTKGSSTYAYDVLGGLRQYSKGSLTVSYEIDPKQRRAGRIINGALTSRYAYNPEGEVVGQLDANNKLIKTFVYATKSHVPDYYIDQNNNKFKIITDHLGSVRMVVSKSGRVLQLMEHDEFGRVLQDTRPGFLPFGFAGGLYEHRTGLVRFQARDYDSQTGRWTAKDPIRFDAGDTNLYGYVFNDPVNFIDPSGKFYFPMKKYIEIIYDKVEKVFCDLTGTCRTEPEKKCTN